MIPNVLHNEFCGKIQHHLHDEHGECNLQNFHFKHDGATGILVNFLKVITHVTSSVADLVAKLKNINKNLHKNTDLDIIPGVISGE